MRGCFSPSPSPVCRAVDQRLMLSRMTQRMNGDLFHKEVLWGFGVQGCCEQFLSTFIFSLHSVTFIMMLTVWQVRPEAPG